MVIDWNPDPVLFSLGAVDIRYYGIFWAIGICCSCWIVERLFKDRGWDEALYAPLFFYCFWGVILGARLGHCLFYQPDYYLRHASEIVLPVRFLPDGGWKFTGYAGLASHGGLMGLIIAVFLFCRRYKVRFLELADMLTISAFICGFWIRMANLMNSEIVGRVTDVPWAFVFHRLANDPGMADALAPRHPAQLYEALFYLLLAVIVYLIYRKYGFTLPLGFYMGIGCVGVFTFRFLIEFIKERQVLFEEGMALDMGQWLSIPFILLGGWLLFFYREDSKKLRPSHN